MTTATDTREITDFVTAIAAFASHTKAVTVSGINGTLYLVETDDGRRHVAIIARNPHDIGDVGWVEPIRFEETVGNNA